LNLIGNSIFFLRKKKKIPADVNKILVISLYFRGDMLFQTPVIKALRKIFPDAKIDVWCKSRSKEVLFNNPGVNEIMVFDKIRTADYNEENELHLKKKMNFLSDIRDKKYDFCLDLTGKYSTALFCLLGSIKYSAGINYNGFGFCYNNFIDLDTQHTRGHLTGKYLEILRRALLINETEWKKILTREIRKPELYTDRKIETETDKELSNRNINAEKDLIVIHAASGWKAKELPSETFVSLIKKLNLEIYCEIILVGSKNDEEQTKNILIEAGLDPDNHSIASSLMVTAELIKRCSVFIGSDSVPLHIAGSLGTPSVALFGPTNPGFSNPEGEMHKFIYKKLECSAPDNEQYCTRNAGKTCRTLDCMRSITAEEIVFEVKELLEKFSKKAAVNEQD
jgi:lipopolysaccharide heptosyltransferase II